jgi:hypothetical protein
LKAVEEQVRLHREREREREKRERERERETRARTHTQTHTHTHTQWMTSFDTGNVIQTIVLGESKPSVAVKLQNEEVRYGYGSPRTSSKTKEPEPPGAALQGMAMEMTSDACAKPQMSWEKYRAALVGKGGTKSAAAMAVNLSPTSGEMAPRGKEGQRVRTDASDPM